MGGRGSAGGGLDAGQARRGMSLSRFLAQQDIARANAASVTDMGDIIRRTFERNAAEINGLNLPDAEKKAAVKQMGEPWTLPCTVAGWRRNTGLISRAWI